jgi:hypothetical protein
MRRTACANNTNRTARPTCFNSCSKLGYCISSTLANSSHYKLPVLITLPNLLQELKKSFNRDPPVRYLDSSDETPEGAPAPHPPHAYRAPQPPQVCMLRVYAALRALLPSGRSCPTALRALLPSGRSCPTPAPRLPRPAAAAGADEALSY